MPLNKVVTYLIFLPCRYFYWKNGKSPNNCEKIGKWGHSQPDVLFKEGFSQGTRDGLQFHRGEESSDTPSRLMRGKPGKLLARWLQCKLCFTNFCLNGYTRESVHLQPEKFEPAHAVNEWNSVWYPLLRRLCQVIVWQLLRWLTVVIRKNLGENLFLISIYLSYFDLLPIGLGARVRDNS